MLSFLRPFAKFLCRPVFGLCLVAALPSLALSQAVSSASVSPTSVLGGMPATLSVKLTAPAGKEGLALSFASSNSAVKLPHDARIRSGSDKGSGLIKTSAVSSPTSVTITVTGGGASTTTTLLVMPPELTGLLVDPKTVVGGKSSHGVVTLSGPAPDGGLALALSSDNGAATVPATVTIPSGKVAGYFEIATTAVNSPAIANITADHLGVKQTAQLTINLGGLSGLQVPEGMVGTRSASGRVMLSAPAPAGGTQVALASDDADLTVPASVTVPAGERSATFTLKLSDIAAKATGHITATQGTTFFTKSVATVPLSVTHLELSAKNVVGGASVQIFGRVELNAEAGPNGVVVNLVSSDSTVASVPATVTVSAGKKSAGFSVGTFVVTTAKLVTISATHNGSVSDSLMVNPAKTGIARIGCSPDSFVGGSPTVVNLGVELVSVQTTDTVITLSSSDSAVLHLPATITVPAGKKQFKVAITHSAPAASEAVTITATGFGSDKMCTVRVRKR